MAINMFLVVGNGSMGQRRVKIIQDYFKASGKSVIVDTLDPVNGHFKSSSEVTMEKYDALFICSPPVNHGPWATYCMDFEIPVFVEKPFCLPGEMRPLQDQVRDARKPVMVGYNLLWHEGFRKFKEECVELDILSYTARYGNLLTNWARDNKDSYSRHRDQGGGVLLDCLQDIDLALEITGGLQPTAHLQQLPRAKGTTTEDSEVLSTTLAASANFSVSACLHFNYLSKTRTRRHTAVGEYGEAEWVEEGQGEVLDKSYRDETEAFLKWVGNGERPKLVPDPFRALEFVGRIYTL